MKEFDLTQYGGLRMEILQILAAAGGKPLSIPEILKELEIPDSRLVRTNISQVLLRARKAGEVDRTQRGRYIYSGPPLE